MMLKLINNQSGNETAAHILLNPRMKGMFTAFEGKPLTLRLYGNTKVIHPTDKRCNDFYSLFKPTEGARQVFEVEIDLVQNFYGMSIPLFEYVGERPADKLGKEKW